MLSHKCVSIALLYYYLAYDNYETSSQKIYTMKNKFYRCRVCDKLIIFRDEVDAHCLTEHNHTANYLDGYYDALEELKKGVNKFLTK